SFGKAFRLSKHFNKQHLVFSSNYLCFQFYGKRHSANVLYFTNDCLRCIYIDTNDGNEYYFVSRFKRRSSKWRKQSVSNNATIINKFRNIYCSVGVSFL